MAPRSPGPEPSFVFFRYRHVDRFEAGDDEHYFQVVKVHRGLDSGRLVEIVVLALHFGNLSDQYLAREVPPQARGEHGVTHAHDIALGNVVYP